MYTFLKQRHEKQAHTPLKTHDTVTSVPWSTGLSKFKIFFLKGKTYLFLDCFAYLKHKPIRKTEKQVNILNFIF